MQKFINKLVFVAVVSGLSASVAFAAGHNYKLTMDCPDISSKTKEMITNYGTYIAGEGTERVNSDVATHPLFQGPTVPGANIPVDLKASGYANSGVSYNASSGSITCNFNSSMGFDPFSISYLMTNALNGVVQGAGNSQIKIKFPVGLK